MKAWIIKGGDRFRITDLMYEETHGVQGRYDDLNFTVALDEFFDILVLNGGPKLIEGCHISDSDPRGAFEFKAIRVRDL